MSGNSLEDMDGNPIYRLDEPNPYDAARAESDLAFIAKKRREIEWWQHNIAAAEEKIARAERRVQPFAIQYRLTVGGARISMANGFIEVNKVREHTDPYDPKAWKAWRDSKEWPADYYDAPTLNESKVKGALQLNDDGSYSFATGQTIAGQPVVEVVPGIRRVKPGPLDFNVKINAGRLDPFEKRHAARTINEESNDADESE